MIQNPHTAGKLVLAGSIRVFLAEALIVPTGLATVVFLTRRLGPEDYGFFALSAAIVIWIEIAISSLFSRSTVQLVSQSREWSPVGSTVIRAQLAIGSVCTLLLWLFAHPMSRLFDAPQMALYIRLFALDIPFFTLAVAHRDIMTGVGRFGARARTTAMRWVGRLFLIVLLVELGLSVSGAILGSVGASGLELLLCRRYIRPSLWLPNSFPLRQLILYSLPLSFLAVSMQAYGKMDLILFKILGGTAEQAGMYSAAQNLSIVPGLVSASLSPVLQSSIGNLMKTGENDSAMQIVGYALRCVVWLLPFAAMTAGAASEIVTLIYGAQYSPASSILALLIFAALAWLIISTASAILIASGKPGWPFKIIGPTVPVAFLAYLLLIPRLGPMGAATVTAFFSVTSAVFFISAVCRIWKLASLAGTLLKSTGVSVLTLFLAMIWPTPGFFVLIKIAGISLLILCSLFLLREIGKVEIAFLGSLLSNRRNRVPV